MTSIPEIQFGDGYTVNVHGSLATYPGVILHLIPDTRRACVQWWCDVRQQWFTNGVDLDRLAPAEHEIGACMACGKYDWYARFDDWCDCAECQSKRQPEPEPEESDPFVRYDLEEDEYKLRRR